MNKESESEIYKYYYNITLLTNEGSANFCNLQLTELKYIAMVNNILEDFNTKL